MTDQEKIIKMMRLSTLATLAAANWMPPATYNYFGKPPKPKQEPTAADYARIQAAGEKRARRAERRLGGGQQ